MNSTICYCNFCNNRVRPLAADVSKTDPNAASRLRSCFTLILNYYFDRNTGNYTWVYYLGKERSGTFSGQFNCIGGSPDPCDGGCMRRNACRETLEEAKIDCEALIARGQSLNNFDNSPIFFVNGTVFTVIVLKGITRGRLNSEIAKCNANRNLHWSYREMECIEAFKLSDSSPLSGNVQGPVSAFASRTISTFHRHAKHHLRTALMSAGHTQAARDL